MKPAAGTPINWGDPLAAGLVSAWLFSEGAGLLAKNSVNPKYDARLADTTNYSWKPSPYGIAVNAKPSSTQVITLNNGLATGTKFTIAGGLYIRSFPNAFGSLLLPATGNGLYVLSAGKIQYYPSSASSVSPAIATNAFIHFGVTADGATLTYYVNGVSLGVAGSYSGQTMTTMGSDSSSERIDGALSYMYVWNRGLGLSELRRLMYAPYCFFVESRFPVTMDVGGAAALGPAPIIFNQAALARAATY